VTEERSRGAMLYAFAAMVLVVGGVWFVRAAPQTGVDPRVPQWRATAERLVPDEPLGGMSESIVLSGNNTTERDTPIDGGSYVLTVVCAGTGQVRVRLSTTGTDSGRAVPCSDDPSPQLLRVALADEFHLEISAEDEHGGAVFRWRLNRSRGY
jgi:hypothetical protein